MIHTKIFQRVIVKIPAILVQHWSNVLSLVGNSKKTEPEERPERQYA